MPSSATTQKTRGVQALAHASADVSKEQLASYLQLETREREIGATFDSARLNLSLDSIQRLTPDELKTWQSLLEHGNEFGFWCTPKRWCLNMRFRDVERNIDLEKRIAHHAARHLRTPEAKRAAQSPMFQQAVSDATLLANRYLLLCRLGPANMSLTTAKPLDVTTIIGLGYARLPKILGMAVAAWFANSPHSPGFDARGAWRILNDLPMDALAGLSRSMYEDLTIEIRRMQRFASQGLWASAPMMSLSLRESSDDAGKPTPLPKGVHLPLPDDFVADLGSKAAWIVTELGPNLIRLAKSVHDICKETWRQTDGLWTIRNLRVKMIRQLLKDFKWQLSDGTELTQLRFPITPSLTGRAFVSRGRTPTLSLPRTPLELLGLLGHLQSAHLFIVGLSMGARSSELTSLLRDCLVFSKDGTPFANGLTFKLVDCFEGETRDWPMPNVAVSAIEQQLRLVAIAEVIPSLSSKDPVLEPLPNSTSSSLWCSLSAGASSNRAQSLVDPLENLSGFIRALGLPKKPGGQTFRVHRLRKTLARIVGLALTESPRVLMQIFGHKNIEATLYYILTDRAFAADVEKVARELRIMIGTKVVEAMVAEEDALDAKGGLTGTLTEGGFGGAAAEKLRGAVKNERAKVHETGARWGANDTIALVDVFTLQGRSFQYVRPGVICTKNSMTESGPCNYSVGRPEPSKCSTKCDHRLEEAFLRKDVEASIQACIGAYEATRHDDTSLSADFYAGQLIGHVMRFPDLRAKWETHPSVIAARNEVSEPANQPLF